MNRKKCDLRGVGFCRASRYSVGCGGRRFGTGFQIVTGLLVLVVFGVAAPRVDAEVTATYELGPGQANGTVFTLPLNLDFSASAGEELVFFSVDVSASDGGLTGSDSDYTKFAFSRSPALNGFDLIPGTGFGMGGLKQAVEFDTVTTPLVAGRYLLGELSFDMAGFVGDLPQTVSVEAMGTTIGTEEPNKPATFDFIPLQFNPGKVEIVVPEPTGAGSWIYVLASISWLSSRSRSRR